MNEKVVWDYLMERIGNAYGVAAVMGNLMAESSLSPACVTGLKKTGIQTVAQYIACSDRGTHDFANDGVAFGLAQWCYHTRKQGLLEKAKAMGLSVGDLHVQLEYMWKEMIGYKTVWNAVLTATNVRDASDVVMLKYEKPANTGDAAKKKRADYGEAFYRQFAGNAAPKQDSAKQDSAKAATVRKVRAKTNVNMRTGPSKAYAKIGALAEGMSLEWIATAENGWHAVKFMDGVYWMSGEFTEVIG